MEPSPAALARRRLRRGILVASLTGAAALAALAALARDGEPPIAALALVDPGYLALALAMTLAAWWLRAVRSRILVQALGVPVPLRRLFSYYLSSAFVSHVTPTSTGGVPVFVYLLTREGLSVGRATAVAVIDSGLVAVWLMAAWPAAGLGIGLGGSERATVWMAAVAVALGVVAGLVVWIVACPRSLAAAFLRLRAAAAGSGRMGGWLHRLLGQLAREGLRFSRALRFFVFARPWALAAAVLTTGVYWVAYLSIAWAVVRGLGGQPAWLDVAVRQLAFNMAQAFIPTPGGSGGAELMMAYLLRGMVAPSRLAVAVGVWRLFTFYASLAVGGVLFLRTLRAGKRQSPGQGESRARGEPVATRRRAGWRPSHDLSAAGFRPGGRPPRAGQGPAGSGHR